MQINELCAVDISTDLRYTEYYTLIFVVLVIVHPCYWNPLY